MIRVRTWKEYFTCFVSFFHRWTQEGTGKLVSIMFLLVCSYFPDYVRWHLYRKWIYCHHSMVYPWVSYGG